MSRRLQKYKVTINGIVHTSGQKEDLVDLKKHFNSKSKIVKIRKPHFA